MRIKVVKDAQYREWGTADVDSVDIVRKEIGFFGKEIPDRRSRQGTTWDRIPVRRQYALNGYMSRVSAREGKYSKLGNSDIFWDQIKSVEPLGEEEVYDIGVPADSNFVANDIFVHNSTDAGYSFPTALFVAAPGATKCIQSVCGYEPKTVSLQTIPEVTELLGALSGKFETVVIDDFSFLAEQTFSVLERKNSGFKLWGAMRDTALEFRDKARYANVNVILTCWEQAPKTNGQGQKIRGGPQLSGKLPEQIPALCDVVLRGVHEPKRKPWGAVYRCTLDPQWVMKDRLNIASIVDPAPMNLAEILRASGHQITRHPNYPDMEKWVETISAELSGDQVADTVKANEFYMKLTSQGVPATAARWTLRDALDRATIRMALNCASLTFFAAN